jgi:hypothetical protein
MSLFDSLFKAQIADVVKGEGDLLEKALLGGKALLDYFFDRLHAGSVTINFSFPKVEKATPADPNPDPR